MKTYERQHFFEAGCTTAVTLFHFCNMLGLTLSSKNVCFIQQQQHEKTNIPKGTCYSTGSTHTQHRSIRILSPFSARGKKNGLFARNSTFTLWPRPPHAPQPYQAAKGGGGGSWYGFRFSTRLGKQPQQQQQRQHTNASTNALFSKHSLLPAVWRNSG